MPTWHDWKVTRLLFLLARYLIPQRGNLLSFSLWISALGVALGIVQLMVVLGVMSGFIEVFEKHYTRITSDLVVIPRDPSLTKESLSLSLGNVSEIEAHTPVLLSQGMVIGNGGVGGVTLEGIDWPSSQKVTDWEKIWVAPPLWEEQKKNSFWIWLGQQLANKLHVKPGDKVDLLVADGNSKKIIPFTVTGILKFGIYDHDLRYARLDIQILNEVFSKYKLEPFYKCKVRETSSVDEAYTHAKNVLSKRAVIKKWSDVNKNIFQAVHHQKMLLFLILQIVIGLAAMNVVSFLLINTHQKRRDIGILQAMGMRAKHVLSVFVLQGAVVGFFGVVIGIVLGWILCQVIVFFQPEFLSEAIYNITRLPIRIRWSDVALMGTMALGLCTVFSFLPALSITLRGSLDSLRHE
jgi:lipoprotein-releasing system permease protein